MPFDHAPPCVRRRFAQLPACRLGVTSVSLAPFPHRRFVRSTGASPACSPDLRRVAALASSAARRIRRDVSLPIATPLCPLAMPACGYSPGIRARVFACFQMRLSPHYRSQCACPMSTQSVRRCDRTHVTARFLRRVLPCLHAAGVCVSVSVVPCYHNICVTSSPSSTVIVPGPCYLRCHISRRLCVRSS